MSANWKVVPLATRHLSDAVDVHQRAFPEFFLTFLGPGFLEEFYRSFLDDPGGIGLAAEDNSGRVLGVVVGPLRPEGYFRKVLKRRWWAFGVASLVAVLNQPTILPRLLRALVYRGDPPPGAPRSLLSSIAVAPEAQGLGIGAALVQTWLQEVLRRGSSGCYLTTDAESNEAVNHFYRKLGWTLESSYATPQGRRMNRYVLDFSGGASSYEKQSQESGEEDRLQRRAA